MEPWMLNSSFGPAINTNEPSLAPKRADGAALHSAVAWGALTFSSHLHRDLIMGYALSRIFHESQLDQIEGHLRVCEGCRLEVIQQMERELG